MPFANQLKRAGLLSFLMIWILAASECGIYSQKAKDIFASGERPKMLEELSNPPLTPEQEQRAIEDVSRGRLRAAVIDNGVDYLNPALIGHINWRIKDNRVVGAGYDVMGADQWSHPSIVNPILFAFGAKGLDRSAKIVGPVEDPLALYDSMNDRYMDLIIQGIQSDKDLQNSLFQKITKDSISLAGYVEYLNEDRLFDREYYNKRKEKDTLLTLSNSNKEERLKEADSSAIEHERRRDRYIRELNWFMGDDSGWPKFGKYASLSISDLTSMEHADKFFDLLEKSYKAVNKEMNFEKAFSTYVDFKLSRLSSQEESIKDYRKQSAQDLHSSWYRWKSSYLNSDPMMNLVFQIRDQMDLERLMILESKAASTAEKERVLRSALDEWFDRVRQAFEYMINHKKLKSTKEKVELQKMLDGFEDLENRFMQYVDRRGIHQLFEDHPYSGMTDAEPYRNYGYQIHNPYLATTANQGTSHGSHVSGTIITEAPGVLIEGVRVVTSGKQNSKNFDRKLVTRYINDFKQWLKVPLVTIAVYDVFKGLIDPDGQLDPKRDANAIINKVAEIAKTNTLSSIEDDRLDFEFFYEIMDAIKYVGSQKIKLANVSLGTSFSDVPARVNPDDKVQLKADMMKFLQYEFFKYKIGETIKNHASKTVFFVAAGNDNAWFDGDVRSALPADVSSALLRDYEQATGMKAPNNHLDNVVAVVSIGPEHKLSSFTNVPFSPIPVVFAQGESIQSAIKLTDFTGAMQEYQKLFGSGPTEQYISPYNENLQEMVRKLGWIENADSLSKEDLEEAAQSELKHLAFLTDEFVKKIHEALVTEHCINSVICDAKMSGTSMASPTATGITAREVILAEMDRLNLTDAQIYDDPRFSPKKIIEKALKKVAERFGGRGLVANAPTFRNVTPYKPVPKVPLSQVPRKCADALLNYPSDSEGWQLQGR